MSLAWIGVAVMLEIASCAAYVVIFRLFFAEVPPTSLVGSPGPKRDRARCCRPAVSGLWQSEDGCFASGNVDPEDC